MSKAEPSTINAHEDVALFREAVRFTAAESGFVPRLIEKDYFCTLLLAYLSEAAGDGVGFQRRDLPDQGPFGALPPERGLGLYYCGSGGRPST